MYCKQLCFKVIGFIIFNIVFTMTVHAFTPQEDKIKDELDDQHWMQSLHETVSNSVHQSAHWFDSFFIANNVEQLNPSTTAKIRFAWLPKSRDWNDVETRLRVKMKLPHLQNKASLELSDESEDDLDNLPLESVNTHPNTRDEKFSLAFNYVSERTSKTLTKYRLGISGGDIFARAKHKKSYVYKEKHGFLVEPSLYYYLNDGVGAKLLLEYDYQLSKKSQFRLNYSIRGSESFSGIRWKHGLYHLDQIDNTTATVVSLQVEGERNGSRGFFIDNYTASYRYRFNALREWLYFEIEPFLEFPEQENYKTTPGIALRVEGFFHKG